MQDENERVELQLEGDHRKIRDFEGQLQAALDEAAAVQMETKVAQESTRAATKRVKDAIRKSMENDAVIAALERRLKLSFCFRTRGVCLITRGLETFF